MLLVIENLVGKVHVRPRPIQQDLQIPEGQALKTEPNYRYTTCRACDVRYVKQFRFHTP